MPCCNVTSCTNHTGRSTKNTNIRLFCFPKDRKFAERWLYLCRRADIKASISQYKFTDNDRICSVHFAPDSYAELDLKSRMLIEKGTMTKAPAPKLKKDAVPTLNLPMDSAQTSLNKRSSSEARLATKDKDDARKRVSFTVENSKPKVM